MTITKKQVARVEAAKREHCQARQNDQGGGVKKLEYCHDPLERALNCSVVLGIHINHANEGYGGAPSLRCTIGEEVVFHSTKTATVTWLCGLHFRAAAVLSLLKSEGIDFADKDAAIKSLSETVQAKANREFYIKYVLPVAGEITI